MLTPLDEAAAARKIEAVARGHHARKHQQTTEPPAKPAPDPPKQKPTAPPQPAIINVRSHRHLKNTTAAPQRAVRTPAMPMYLFVAAPSSAARSSAWAGGAFYSAQGEATGSRRASGNDDARSAPRGRVVAQIQAKAVVGRALLVVFNDFIRSI